MDSMPDPEIYPPITGFRTKNLTVVPPLLLAHRRAQPLLLFSLHADVALTPSKPETAMPFFSDEETQQLHLDGCPVFWWKNHKANTSLLLSSPKTGQPEKVSEAADGKAREAGVEEGRLREGRGQITESQREGGNS
ncbi:hypothetical protein ACLOJK_027779 [Asimina triloba]